MPRSVENSPKKLQKRIQNRRTNSWIVKMPTLGLYCLSGVLPGSSKNHRKLQTMMSWFVRTKPRW
uniref:Uncharacterized protein n=1 Tax=Brassica oleracea TaxID=3712 RepID=A0A3P6AZ90_BRAOL|nr:unnamed protein product [Brassica oleracea]